MHEFIDIECLSGTVRPLRAGHEGCKIQRLDRYGYIIGNFLNNSVLLNHSGFDAKCVIVEKPTEFASQKCIA